MEADMKVRKLVLATVFASITMAVAVPTFADDGWHRPGWREQAWREHARREQSWREHEWRERQWRRQYYPPPYVAAPRYYTPPQAYYGRPGYYR
jgi:hypothetical protein